MQAFRIQGGNKLYGDVVPQGAKNEALQIICATLLTSEEVVISNIPDIIDVNKLINLLSSIGYFHTTWETIFHQVDFLRHNWFLVVIVENIMYAFPIH